MFITEWQFAQAWASTVSWESSLLSHRCRNMFQIFAIRSLPFLLHGWRQVFVFLWKPGQRRRSENCNFWFHLNPLLGVFVPEIVDHHIATSGVGLGQWHLQLNVWAEIQKDSWFKPKYCALLMWTQGLLRPEEMNWFSKCHQVNLLLVKPFPKSDNTTGFTNNGCTDGVHLRRHPQ